MRFLANENVPGPVVAALRKDGHDVFYVKESMPGAEDPVVLALAQAEQRVVVTSDTDFGELAFRSGLPAQCGVVLFRFDWTNPEADNQKGVRDALLRHKALGNPVVIERDGKSVWVRAEELLDE